MARRRTGEGPDEFEEYDDGAPIDGGRFGNGRDRPDTFFALSPEEQQGVLDWERDNPAIAGNTTTGRELFGAWMRPTTPEIRQTPGLVPMQEETGGPDAGRRDDGLPRGMTVQSVQGYDADMGGGDDGGGGQSAFATPMMPHEPSPISGMTPNPQIAPQTTRRVSSPGSQSALFSDASGGSPMFGRAGGLTGGGKGVLGSNEGGPAPTEMMLSLLRMLRNGA